MKTSEARKYNRAAIESLVASWGPEQAGILEKLLMSKQNMTSDEMRMMVFCINGTQVTSESTFRAALAMAIELREDPIAFSLCLPSDGKLAQNLPC
jgi:hypothetical protein